MENEENQDFSRDVFIANGLLKKKIKDLKETNKKLATLCDLIRTEAATEVETIAKILDVEMKHCECLMDQVRNSKLCVDYDFKKGLLSDHDSHVESRGYVNERD